MGTPGAAASPPPDLGPLPPAPVIDSFGTPPPPRSQRPLGSSRRTSKAPRPRTAGSKTSRAAARVAVPIVFLVAVIALIGIVTKSGVIGGSTATPTPTTTSTKSGSVTKKYVVKSGDSLSSIAVRFNTSTEELKQLNPDLQDTTTLVVGTRIVVPRP